MVHRQQPDRGKLKLRSPLVPHWFPVGDGWLIGFIFRSAFHRVRPRQLITREDMSDFYHAFDE